MIITADKKAVTKADHDRLLDASHALAAPFGIPTVVIQPQDLLQYAYYKPLLLPGLQEAIKKKLYKHPEDLDVLLRAEKHCKQSCFGETDAEIDALMLYARDYRQGFFAMAMPLVNTCEAHKKFFKEEYEEPSFNVILAQGKDARINKLLSQSFSRHARGFPEFSSDGVDRIIGLPFYVFWHECAHGAGAAEPQADKMAAMAMRKAFKASTFLNFWADQRAMDAILKGSEDHLLKYGWPMVEVNDEVASMPDSYIDGLGEQDIKAYRFESFEHKVDDVLAVREMLQNAVVDARTIESLKPVHRRVVKLDNKPPAKINDTQRQIISRTALAAERILTGPSAYL